MSWHEGLCCSLVALTLLVLSCCGMYPLKLVFCRGSKEYIHGMDLPSGNQGWSHWFRLLWLHFGCHCAFKLSWFPRAPGAFCSIGNSCLPPDEFRAWVLSGCFCSKTGPGHRHICICNFIYTLTYKPCTWICTCVYIPICSLQCGLYLTKLSPNVTFFLVFLMAYMIGKAIN